VMAITVQSNIAFGLWFKVHFCDEHHMAIPRLHGLRFDKAKVSWVLKAALLFLDTLSPRAMLSALKRAASDCRPRLFNCRW
jgi:hypothetical protein